MWDIRTITAEDSDLFRSRLSRGFGSDLDSDDSARERFDAIFDYERTFAVFDGDDIVGTGGAFSLGLTVPGGYEIPMGGTTIITVQPTHRRRGILRQLMDRHLEEVSERGEPLAGLWASEATIYERFGYGPATYSYETTIDASAVSFRESLEKEGKLRLVEKDEAAELLPPIYERVRLERPGMLTRSEEWWTHRRLADPESWRNGKSAQRYLVCEVDGEPAGYAIYRQKSKWEDSVARGEVDVVEVVASDHAPHRSLWSFLTNVDLFPRVSFWNLALDDPLLHLVTDRRRVRGFPSDALWVRVMDIPLALEGRAYETDGAVSFAVADETRPDNAATYRLEVEEGVAHCEEYAGEADLALDVAVLGHLYLGGGDAHGMVAAGLLVGDPTAVTTLHRMFRTDAAPWCPEIF